MFVVLFILIGLAGGWWLFRLSADHYAEAALMYGAIGTIWAFACLGIAGRLALT